MGAEDVHAQADVALSDLEENQALAHLVQIDLVAGLELGNRFDVPIAVLLCDSDGRLRAQALGLVLTDEVNVIVN